MDFSYTEEQEAVRELSRQILGDAYDHAELSRLERDESGDGIDGNLWRSLAEANLLGVGLPEESGGSELGLQALCILLEEAGSFVSPIPLLPTLVYGALPIAEFGSEHQKEKWLAGVASGDVILTAGLQEVGSSDPARPKLSARQVDEGYVLDGEKVCVPAAHVAQRVLLPARLGDDRVAVFLVDPKAEGVLLDASVPDHYERQFRMQLTGVRVASDDLLRDASAGGEIVEWLMLRAQVALCAMQLGVAESAMRQTAEYVGERKQFGRPIGTFQAVTMRLADAFIDVEAMRSTLWQAAWRLEDGRSAAKAVAAAKWWACRGGQRVVHSAQHLHAGIGSDIDYPIHRYFLWARQLEVTLGAASQQLERLGRMIAED